jgi:hypothetical protein
MVEMTPAEGYQDATVETIPLENDSGHEHNEASEGSADPVSADPASADSSDDPAEDATNNRSGDA